MQIETTRFGLIEVDDEKVLKLDEGLVGLPELRRFLLLDDEGREPFRWLQSVDEPSLAFVVLDPNWLVPGYSEGLPPGIASAMGADDPGNIEFFVLVTIPQDPQEMTANLKAPVAINKRTRKAAQVILDDEEFSLRHPILSAQTP